MLGTLGVVFGDIGTSPLYTLRECLHAIGLPLSHMVVFGILSLIFWSLILIVTIQYVAFVLKADNRGEGGIFSLTALAFDHVDKTRFNPLILMAGLVGGALFYGDALITPAISVLSAVEGLEVVTPAFKPHIIQIAMFIIVLLFYFQRYGTHKVGNVFGPVMVLWFGTLAALGLTQIIVHPDILFAINPFYGIELWHYYPIHSFFVMGAVVLAITGAEALYADMGHFGRRPIRLTWIFFVMPALALNYFGQGALVLANPEAAQAPFYLLAPEELRLALVALATAACVIASQAVISGAFSLTSQAIQLGYLPRITIKHTSTQEVGQVYLPGMNGLMMVAVLMLILTFRTSSNLAAAYGLTVTGTIVITTVLTSVVLIRRLNWSTLDVICFLALFLSINLLFFYSNFHKIPHGGWFPLVFAMAVFYLMHTFVRGRQLAQQHHIQFSPQVDEFLENPPQVPRTPRTAIFLTGDINHIPPALIYNLKHNGVLHEQVILLKIARARIPRYPESERVRVTFLKHGFATINCTYGFMEQPDVPHLLARAAYEFGLEQKYPQATSYFLSHHTYVASTAVHGLNKFQEPIFLFLEGLTQSAITYFKIPNKDVIEIGAQVEI